MNDEIFIDTNVLFYAFDVADEKKRAVAKKIIKEITDGKKSGVISNQVLAELFSNLTKKAKNPLEKETAQAIINGFIDSTQWKKVNYTEKTVSRAIESSLAENMHFWDALICETMLENKVYLIFTENTKDFRSKLLKVKNPFKGGKNGFGSV